MQLGYGSRIWISRCLLSLPLHSCLRCVWVPSLGFLMWASVLLCLLPLPLCWAYHLQTVEAHFLEPLLLLKCMSWGVCPGPWSLSLLIVLQILLVPHIPLASQGMTRRHVVMLFSPSRGYTLPSLLLLNKIGYELLFFSYPTWGMRILFNTVSPVP